MLLKREYPVHSITQLFNYRYFGYSYLIMSLFNCLKIKKPHNSIDEKQEDYLEFNKPKTQKKVKSSTNMTNATNITDKQFRQRKHYKIQCKINMIDIFENKQKENEIKEICDILTDFNNKYELKKNNTHSLDTNKKHINLTSNQYCHIQTLIEKTVKNDDVNSLNKILLCVGLYYLEPEICILAAKMNSYKCINWFIINKVFIDKFVCEECIKQKNFTLFKLTFVNLSEGSISGYKDIVNFCVIALLNDSYECFVHIIKKINKKYKIIPKEIIKNDDIHKIDLLFKNGFVFNHDNIEYACKYDFINTIKYAHTKKYLFSKKHKEIAKTNESMKCYTFITNNTSNLL